MKIGIDIDDTLTNTKENQIKLWKEYYNNKPKVGFSEQLPPDINEFDVDEYISIFWDTYRNELSFNSTFKENTSTIINQLIKDGHQLCIITSRPDYKYDDLKGKLRKIFKENNINIETLYTDIRDKGIFCKENNIDLLIDDSLKHVTNTISLGKKAILFNNIPSYKGLQTDNWIDLYNIIKSTI